MSFCWPGGSHPEASTTVHVAPGEQVSVEYRTPLMFGAAPVQKPALSVVHPHRHDESPKVPRRPALPL